MKPYYQDDAVTIHHGDCREILPTLTAVDLVVTDPPYGVGFKYAGEGVSDTGGEAYYEWLLPVIERLRAMTALLLVTPGVRNAWRYPQPTWALCWGKPGSPRRSDLGGFNEWEPILVYGKRRIYNDFKRLPAWNNTTVDAGDHPCPKPLQLMRWLVDAGSDPGQMVLDPFMGSGTTLRAAKDLGRKVVGIEIEERYCEIAAKRCAQDVFDFGVAA